MADHLRATKVKVSGHLEERYGLYYMMLNWNENGKRRRKAISTKLPVKGNKKRAEEMLNDARKNQEALLKDKPRMDKLLFSDFLGIWLNAIRREVKPTTFGGYQMNVERIIAPYFRKKKILLAELTADDVMAFYEKQLERVKGSTVITFHANISNALKYAVEKDYIPYSVMNKVKRPKAEKFVGKFMKQSEMVKLFEAVKGHKLELGVTLGAFYGLRRAEVVGLRWESINFEANTITIEHSVTIATIDGKAMILADDTTKTKSSLRTLPLVPAIRAKLLEVQAKQQENRELCGKSYNKKESAYIYTDVLGNRIKPYYLTNEFPVFLEKNGFQRMRFHDLRHSCASLLLANGVSLKQIQEWLGHSDFAITANTYAHLDFTSKIASAASMAWIEDTPLSALTDGKEAKVV